MKTYYERGGDEPNGWQERTSLKSKIGATQKGKQRKKQKEKKSVSRLKLTEETHSEDRTSPEKEKKEEL